MENGYLAFYAIVTLVCLMNALLFSFTAYFKVATNLIYISLITIVFAVASYTIEKSIGVGENYLQLALLVGFLSLIPVGIFYKMKNYLMALAAIFLSIFLLYLLIANYFNVAA